MSMSGMRTFTVRVGLVKRIPPQVVAEEEAGGLLKRFPEHRREAVVELMHWAYGAGGGAVFGALPARLRLQPWAGPLYGLVMWLGFDVVLEPLLGLDEWRRRTLRERVALGVDHLLYGAVLDELRRRPQG